jgi:vancomycin resistance protein YoaR
MSAYQVDYDTQPFAPLDDQPRTNPWLIRLPLLLITGSVLLVLLLTAALGVYQVYVSERIVPGVSSYGLALGGMTPAAAQTALESRFTYDDQATFTFRNPIDGRFWQMSARDLGVSFDAEATVNQAFSAGHGDATFQNIINQGLIWLNGRSIAPVIRYEQAAALEALTAIAAEINRPAVDASLSFDGVNVLTTAGQIGQTLDIGATLAQLENALLTMQSGGEIELVINETPPIAWDADAAAARARAAISGPIMLIADDGTGTGGTLGPWTASVSQIAALLRVEPVTHSDGTLSYEVTVNVEPFRSYLDDLARGLIVTPKDGRFHFDESSGQLQMIASAVNGRTLNVDETLRNMEAAIFNPSNRVVPLVFDYALPDYHNNVTAAELGITEMVSQGTSFYTGSTRSRIDNIILAASRFDGIIIAPGETFSFNEYVGNITPEEGYVSGKVIYGGRTIDGVGGGVCQVSTTAFRAAFYAGFPFVERHAHGYRVGYYERGDPEGVGMDAAIYTPDLDMRFINDTPYHLLIETSVFPANSSVQFRFYSTNPGRQVVKEGPVIRDVTSPLPTRFEINPDLTNGQELYVDWAAEGAYVEVTRRILDANGVETRRDTIRSQYQPWGAIVQVASGDPRAQTG